MSSEKKIIKKIAIVAGIIVGLYLLLLFIAGIYINSKKKVFLLT